MSDKYDLDEINEPVNSIVEHNNVSSVISTNVVNNTTSSKLECIEIDDATLPRLCGSDFPDEYVVMVNRIKKHYKRLPRLNFDSIYKEISELSIKSSPTPTLQILNDELHRVQSAKDRLSEILIEIIKCYNFKKRAVDILRDAWGKFTTEKNTEGRRGDSIFRLSNFLEDFAETEALSESCDHVLKNLDSLHDSLSRRITVWQLIIKLRDIGRGGMPDYDFDRNSKESITASILGDKNDGLGDNSEGVKLREF